MSSWTGVPRVVVCDGAQVITNAAEAVWGTVEADGVTAPARELVRCRWHLLKNLRVHVAADLIALELERVKAAGETLSAKERKNLNALAEKMAPGPTAARLRHPSLTDKNAITTTSGRIAKPAPRTANRRCAPRLRRAAATHPTAQASVSIRTAV